MRATKTTLACLAFACLPLAWGGGLLQAQDGDDRDAIPDLIAQLGDPERSDLALAALTEIGQPAVKHLQGEVAEGGDLVRRGWAIVALSEIAHPDAEAALSSLQRTVEASSPSSAKETLRRATGGRPMPPMLEPGRKPSLLGTWVAAARIQRAKTLAELEGLAQLATRYPALGRPLGMAYASAAGTPQQRAEALLSLASQFPQLQQPLIPMILAQGAKPLIKAMLTAERDGVRRQATAYLGTLANRGEPVGALVAELYAFVPGAKAPPWQGGARRSTTPCAASAWPRPPATRALAGAKPTPALGSRSTGTRAESRPS
jgi:hypothetical protein